MSVTTSGSDVAKASMSVPTNSRLMRMRSAISSAYAASAEPALTSTAAPKRNTTMACHNPIRTGHSTFASPLDGELGESQPPSVALGTSTGSGEAMALALAEHEPAGSTGGGFDDELFPLRAERPR